MTAIYRRAYLVLAALLVMAEVVWAGGSACSTIQ